MEIKKYLNFFSKDSLKLGLALGFIAPFIGLYGFYIWKASSAGSFWNFLKFLGYQKSIITNMITFSLITNAVLFTLYVNQHIDKTAKGIFVITMIYCILALLLKIIY